MNNTLLWVIGAFILNDFFIAFTFFKLWRRNFYLHPVPCDCGRICLVPINVEDVAECDDCHVCVNCGKYVSCRTCGKKVLVRQEVETVNCCTAIGCKEKYRKDMTIKYNSQQEK